MRILPNVNEILVDDETMRSMQLLIKERRMVFLKDKMKKLDTIAKWTTGMYLW